MTRPSKYRLSGRAIGLPWAAIALSLSTIFLLAMAAAPDAQAQTFNLLYTFTSQKQGAYVYAGLAMDRKGNLYGTASRGGNGFGTAYELVRKGSGWVFNLLYDFGQNDGAQPYAGMVFGPDGSLYGTTYSGGVESHRCELGCGVVYKLTPPPSACRTALCPWIETPIYKFTGGSDGGFPGYGSIAFDQAGNLYGTTTLGGAYGFGTVFELTPSSGGWTETVLYSFSGGTDGVQPWSAVALGKDGNLYGTTSKGGGAGCGGTGCGTVYQLTPSGSGWKENILYSFQGGTDGEWPYAGLVFDPSGNLYGGTSYGYGGSIFELTPSNGGWTHSVLYNPGASEGPYYNLTLDAAGNLYGALPGQAPAGPAGPSSVFKLSPGAGGWTYTSLYDFLYEQDGEFPTGSVILDADGNIYGTAATAGGYGWGTVWEITP